jgi:uncharacterized protein YegL
MRRLPIFFLIDVSESIVVIPIQMVEEILATIIQTYTLILCAEILHLINHFGR